MGKSPSPLAEQVTNPDVNERLGHRMERYQPLLFTRVLRLINCLAVLWASTRPSCMTLDMHIKWGALSATPNEGTWQEVQIRKSLTKDLRKCWQEHAL